MRVGEADVLKNVFDEFFKNNSGFLQRVRLDNFLICIPDSVTYRLQVTLDHADSLNQASNLPGWDLALLNMFRHTI